MSDAYICIGSPAAGVRVLAFHHAGGSAASFLPLIHKMPEESEFLLFELAGREAGEDGLRAADFDAALQRFLAAVEADDLIDRPCVVVGHSLGALLAHALVAALPADRRRLVRTLVVSSPPRSPQGGTPPELRPSAPFVQRTHDDLLDDLRRYGGCPPWLFEDAELCQHAVRLLGHDSHLTDTYPGAVAAAGVPHRIWYGTADPTDDADFVRDWEESAPGLVEFQGFPGGHFYLYEGSGPAEALGECVRRAMDTSAVSPHHP